jgi:hypothetical protein
MSAAALLRRVGLIGVVLFANLWSLVPVAGAASVPFHDEYSNGLITLCDQNGQPVTSGDTRSEPFAWEAVASSPAPPRYQKGLAYLYAYQPLQYLDPGDWSGEQLTDGSWYSNGQHPIAEATNKDIPMVWFVQAFPAHWNGYVELRMLLSVPGEPPITSPYPTAIIQVKGYHWTLIQGGTTPCNSGTARTLEAQINPNANLNTPKEVSVGVPASSHPTPSTTSAAGSSVASNGSSSSLPPDVGLQNQSAGAVAITNPSGGGGLSSAAIAAIAVAAVMAMAGCVLLLRARNRRRIAPDS